MRTLILLLNIDGKIEDTKNKSELSDGGHPGMNNKHKRNASPSIYIL